MSYTRTCFLNLEYRKNGMVVVERINRLAENKGSWHIKYVLIRVSTSKWENSVEKYIFVCVYRVLLFPSRFLKIFFFSYNGARIFQYLCFHTQLSFNSSLTLISFFLVLPVCIFLCVCVCVREREREESKKIKAFISCFKYKTISHFLLVFWVCFIHYYP